jgi:hypothetical protein
LVVYTVASETHGHTNIKFGGCLFAASESL